MNCKYCGREVIEDMEHDLEEVWHKNCEENTLEVHIEEVVDIKDLFGRSG